MARDVGSYFEKLTKKASGGRRLEAEDSDVPAGDDQTDTRTDTSTSSSGSSSRSGGSITDILRDAVTKGRSAVKETTTKTSDRVRTRRDRRKAPPRGRTLPPEGVVTVEYSPRMDGDPDPGEVVWTWVPFEEDPEQGKDRPVIVIGRRGRKLVGVPLTTKRSDREAQIAIGSGGWDPKRRPSYARIWRMLDLEDKGMRREGSVLPRERFDKVIAAVDEYYEVRHPKATKESAAKAGHEAAFEYDY
jgi:hypothetical protein